MTFLSLYINTIFQFSYLFCQLSKILNLLPFFTFPFSSYSLFKMKRKEYLRGKEIQLSSNVFSLAKNDFCFTFPLDKYVIWVNCMETQSHVNTSCSVECFSIWIQVWDDRESIIRDVWALGQRRESDCHMKHHSKLRTGLICETYVWRRKVLFFFVVALPLIHSPFGNLD